MTPWLTCLFTATSATCVTGLVLVDTAVHWSIFGQAVILLLLQLGGLGVCYPDFDHPFAFAPSYRLVSAPGDGLGHEPGPGSRGGAGGAPRPDGHNACGGDWSGPAGHSVCASVWTAGYLVFHFSQHLCLL